MKKLTLLFFCLLISAGIFAQQGVNFHPLTFDEALAKAAIENKLLFVDCYTSQFDIGQPIAANMRSSKEAGDFFNTHFICVRYDVNTKEGKVLKNKMKIKSCPSYFIIRPDGTVQHMLVGISRTLEEFIVRVNKGLNEQTSLFYLTQLYKKGKMNKLQMLTYREVLKDIRDKENEAKITRELDTLLTEKDKLNKDFWPIFKEKTCIVGSPDFNLLLANLPQFKKNIGEEQLNEYLKISYERVILNYIKGNTENELVSFEELKQQIISLDITAKKQLILRIKLAEFVRDQNMARLIAYMEANTQKLIGMDAWTAFMAFRTLEGKATKEDYKRIVTVLEKLKVNPENIGLAEQMTLAALHYESLSHVGTNFEKLTFKQALEKSRRMDKKLFINCYSSGCDSCKYMNESIFSREETGDYLNSKFICVKYDMEQGEGLELKKELNIRNVPTFITLNSGGTLCHKWVGTYPTPVDFIKNAEISFDQSKTLGALEKKYSTGERNKAFLAQYIHTLEAIGDKDMQGEVANALYESLTDSEKMKEEYWFLFNNNHPYSAAARQFLLANRKEFSKKQGSIAVDRLLTTKMQSSFVAAKKAEKEYVIVANQGLKENTEWIKVIKALQKRHQATIVYYLSSPLEVQAELQSLSPRYVAFVEWPARLNRNYVQNINRMSREIDDDAYVDFRWGIITGYDAASALRLVENSEEPLVVRSALSTTTGVNDHYFEHFGSISDSKNGVWSMKQPGEKLKTDSIKPAQVLAKFYSLYQGIDPDIVFTSSHATENHLEMPFSQGDIRAKGGRLYSVLKGEKVFLPESGKRKVYFPAGNCLIGNVNNSRESMAIAWLNSAKVAGMLAYVVPTWHGVGGWGSLKMWTDNPGQYTLADAFFINMQVMQAQMANYPAFKKLKFSHETIKDNSELNLLIGKMVAPLAVTLGQKPTHDQVGIFYDEDVMVYYGDPKWDVRLQSLDGTNNQYRVDCRMKRKKCILTVVTDSNFNAARQVPCSFIFPKRLKNPQLSGQQKVKTVLADDFILLFDLQAGKTYQLEIATEK